MALIEIRVNRDEGLAVSSRSIVRWVNGSLHVVLAVLLLFTGVGHGQSFLKVLNRCWLAMIWL